MTTARELVVLLLPLLVLLHLAHQAGAAVENANANATKVPITVECGRRPLQRAKAYCDAFGWDLGSQLCKEMRALVARRCSWQVATSRAATEIEFWFLNEVPIVLEDGSATTFLLDPLQDPATSAASFCSAKVAKDGSSADTCAAVAGPYFDKVCEGLAKAGQDAVEEIQLEAEDTRTWLPHSDALPSVGGSSSSSSSSSSSRVAPPVVSILELQQVIRPATRGQ